MTNPFPPKLPKKKSNRDNERVEQRRKTLKLFQERLDRAKKKDKPQMENLPYRPGKDKPKMENLPLKPGQKGKMVPL